MKDKQAVFYAVIVSSVIHIAGIGAMGGLFNFPIKQSLPKTQIVEIDQEKSPLLPEIQVLGEVSQIVPQQIKQAEIIKQNDDSLSLTAKAAQEISAEDMAAKQAMLRYQDMIKQRIETFRKYPLRAMRNQTQGIVSLKFFVFSGGSIGSVLIVRSSGSKLLDEEALNTIKRASPFLPIPLDVQQNKITIHVSIIFSLKQ